MKQSDFSTHEDYLIWYRNYREKNRKKIRQYNKEYNKKYRAKYGFSNEEKWKKNNPEKVNAQCKAQYALKIGKILKEKCEMCNSWETIMHHDDYTRPLEIRWLCRKHHKQIHQLEIKHEETTH